jgi:putative ABC transport system permease protein
MIHPSDCRYTLRLWKRHPGLVLVAGVSLGLGVGASTTMYSVVNTVSHHHLNVEDADRLVVLWTTDKERGSQARPPDWETVQAVLERGRSFEAFGLFQGGGSPVTLSGAEVSRVSHMPVDVNGLKITGGIPLLGRTYRLEDFEDTVDRTEARSVVVSYDAWQRLLGGDPDVIGQTIRVDGETRAVIGVMPRGFRLVPFADDIAFWAAHDLRRTPRARGMIAVGRLKPGVTLAAAQAEATVIARQVLESRGQKPGGAGARVEGLDEAFLGNVRNRLTFLLGAVSFVLLIACANVANLLLASGAARRSELAVRAAAGADRRRLVRQLLTENLLLALVGCAFGLALTFGGIRLFALILPEGIPDLLRQGAVDLRVLGFALGISVLASLLFGLVPALSASRLDLHTVLKEGGRGGSGTRRVGRSALLVAEVALAMVLLVGAGLMLRGFLRELREIPGFDTERLLTGEVLLAGPRYVDKTQPGTSRVTRECEAFFEQVLERVRAVPGVRRAGVISRLPTNVLTVPFAIVGQTAPEAGKEPRADVNEADAQALATLGIRLLQGRGVEESDVLSAPWVAVVNRTFALRHFPGQDPIGRAIRLSTGEPGPVPAEEPRPREIVGVVADVTYPSFVDRTPAAVYIPLGQHVWQYAREDARIHTRKVLALRTSVDPLSLLPAVRAAVAQVDRDQTAHDFRTMEDRVRTSPSVTSSRFFASLFTIFGSLALLLALVGVYGVMSWVVGQRTREFGVRMALGARPFDIVVMLLGESLRPILLGLVLGALGGFGLSRALNAVFFRMAGAEPLVFVLIGVLTMMVALVAAWVPARRVTRLHPQQALRSE